MVPALRKPTGAGGASRHGLGTGLRLLNLPGYGTQGQGAALWLPPGSADQVIGQGSGSSFPTPHSTLRRKLLEGPSASG